MYVALFHGNSTFVLEQKTRGHKRAHQIVAFGVVSYWLPLKGSNQYVAIERRGTFEHNSL
jgi:hypothetical protein